MSGPLMTEKTYAMSTTLPNSDTLGNIRAARDHRHDLWFRRSVKGAALLVLFLLISIAGSTLWGGSLAFKTFGLDFLTSSE